ARRPGRTTPKRASRVQALLPVSPAIHASPQSPLSRPRPARGDPLPRCLGPCVLYRRPAQHARRTVQPVRGSGSRRPAQGAGCAGWVGVPPTAVGGLDRRLASANLVPDRFEVFFLVALFAEDEGERQQGETRLSKRPLHVPLGEQTFALVVVAADRLLVRLPA